MPRTIRNYRILLQRVCGLRAGRAGCSGTLRTDRSAAPEAVFFFWLLAGPLLAIGYLTTYWWMAVPGGLLLLFTLVYLLWPSLRSADFSARQVRQLKTGGSGGRQKRSFDRIRDHDPEFDGKQFLERVEQAFLATQAAWAERRLERIRPFVSDGVFERFRIALAEQDELGESTRLLDPQIVQRFVIHGYAEEAFDVNTVRIDVLGDAERLDSAGQPLTLPLLTARYTEYWSLLRRAGARTTQGKPGLLEGNCPSCGAPVAVNQSARCAYCEANLRNGEHDWVLVEVTQTGRWQSTDPDTVPGLRQIRERDPLFSLACLEDQAAVTFWRLAEAARNGSADALHAGLSAELRSLYAQRLGPGTSPPELPRSRQGPVPDGEFQYVGQRGVEAVDTLGLRIEAERQLALLRVRYTGRILSRVEGSPLRRRGELQGQTLMLLARDGAATTRLESGLTSAHCHHCGAPLGDGNGCHYCGHPAPTTASDWLLIATSHVSPKGYDLPALGRELRKRPAGPA